MKLRFVLAAFLLCCSALISLADTLKLKDGTTLEGKVIPQGEKYWIKLADGSSKLIPKDQVATFTKSAAPVTPVAPAPANGTPSPTTPANKSAASGTLLTGSTSFAAVKSKADKVESPIIAVQLWEKFIDSKPAEVDLANAKLEMEKWKKLDKDKSEKINGKWVGGEDLKKIKKKVTDLVEQAAKDMDGTQTVVGIKKLEDALKMYPNSFEANFGLGYYYLTKGVVGSNGQGNLAYMDKAITALETSAKILPTSAASWSNLAIGYNFRKRYHESVVVAYKAVKIEDSKEIVQNLVNSIALAPPGMQQNDAKIKPIMEDAFILATKHGVSRQGGTWMYIRPHPVGEGPEAPSEVAGEGKPGPAWRGSGFIITEDGYILTNHHVATGDPKTPVKKNISFRVRFDDGDEKNAELIAIDEKADIALMKVKADSPLPILKIAEDNPHQAAKALVLGYPATGSEEASMQISEGQVKSINPGDEHEVWFDLNTTHGNSGGPIVDKNCRVIGILTAGRTVYNVTYVLGVGPKQIQTFIDGLQDKAPKVEFEKAGTGEFDGEKLTERAKKSTVLITAIRGEEQNVNVTTVAEGSTPTTKPQEGEGK